ncbi:MAG: tRNA threonylcarbamoyladenosine dehydratase [Bacteroidales bacterium]|nr:tRNA threonylcarbamoyladenosine dehydratase [Bacteroidales bacterium]
MAMERAIFRRTELLLGSAAMARLNALRVIIFGVGGVGSWCAESLIRSGIEDLCLVDSDRICITNINRQLMATTRTVGQVKVEALRERLLSINPQARITALQKVYSEQTADEFQLDSYDFVIDAIDSLKDKALLIERACRSRAVLFSSMGAALKMDPTRIRVAEFWKVQGDALARALRHRFKREKRYPQRKFLCVYSDEVLPNLGHNSTCGTEKCLCPKAQKGPGDPGLLNHEWCSSKAQINGTTAHITAIFGLTLAGLVLQTAVRDVRQDVRTAPGDARPAAPTAQDS